MFFLVAGVGVSIMLLIRHRPQGDDPSGPWCRKCDYCLKGRPTVAACPECGLDLSRHAPLLRAPLPMALVLAWGVATGLSCLAAARLAPRWEPQVVTFQIHHDMDRYFDVHRDRKSPQHFFDEAFIIHGVHRSSQWVFDFMHHRWTIPGTRRERDIAVGVRSGLPPQTHAPTLLINPRTGSFRYRHPEANEWVQGDALTFDDLLAWLALAQVAVDQDYVREEALVAHEYLRALAGRRPWPELTNPAMTYTPHVSDDRFARWGSLLILLLAVVAWWLIYHRGISYLRGIAPTRASPRDSRA